MTEDESNRIKGEAVTRLGELRWHRATLFAKADRFLAQVDKASVLLSSMTWKHRSGADLPAPRPEDWPSCQDIQSLREDFAAVEKEIRTLEERLREWGALTGG